MFCLSMKINFFNYPVFYQPQNNPKKLLAQPVCDTVSFSGNTAPAKYERHGGWCEFFFERQGIAAKTLCQIPVMKNKTFGINEYKRLTEDEKEYLRSLLNINYMKYDGRKDTNRTVEDDMQFFVKTSYILKNILDEKYPQGWTFVTIGGSCALFAKILEYMGADTMIVPFSRRIKAEKNYQSIDFDKYFNDIGLTKQMLNSKKQIFYADYVSSGKTMDFFEDTLEKTGRKNEHDLFVNFTDLFGYAISYEEKELLDDWFLNCFQIKSYAPCPEMSKVSHFKNAANISKDFEWNFTTKLMNFALLDCLTEWKKKNWF